MANANTCTLKVIGVLCSLVLPALRLACHAGEARAELPVARVPGVVPTVWPVSWMDGFLDSDVASWKKQIGDWAARSACEKLALAEWLAEAMTTKGKSDATGHEWKVGTDDLLLPAGRAKWALELVIGVKLPGFVTRNAPPEYIKKLSEDAHLVVEAYRQGIIVSAADHVVSPEEFALLRRKYKGRTLKWPCVRPDPELALDEFLLEWPPIGRKYEDLVSLIGAKGERCENGYSYTLEWKGGREVTYTFIVQDGMILSMKKNSR